MPHSSKTLLGLLAVALALIALPKPVIAQGTSTTSLSTYAVSLMGGIGGSVDENNAGYGNSAVQLGFSVVTERSVKAVARLGRLGSMDRTRDLLDTDLSYLTVSGQYTFGETGYESGVFLGIGLYRLEGTRRFTAEEVSDTTVGLTGGMTAAFDVSRRVDILAELAFHGLTQGEAQIFATGLVGVSINLK